MRGKKEVDPSVDPPPDLVIEVDVTRSSLDKLGMYAAVGVPEVWRYSNESLAIFLLAERAYRPGGESQALPGATAEDLSRFVLEGRSCERPAWLRAVREWARGLRASGR